jgi:hypothetical protein
MGELKVGDKIVLSLHSPLWNLRSGITQVLSEVKEVRGEWILTVVDRKRLWMQMGNKSIQRKVG